MGSHIVAVDRARAGYMVGCPVHTQALCHLIDGFAIAIDNSLGESLPLLVAHVVQTKCLIRVLCDHVHETWIVM
jgi:hypothetical protein